MLQAALAHRVALGAATGRTRAILAVARRVGRVEDVRADGLQGGHRQVLALQVGRDRLTHVDLLLRGQVHPLARGVRRGGGERAACPGRHGVVGAALDEVERLAELGLRPGRLVDALHLRGHPIQVLEFQAVLGVQSVPSGVLSLEAGQPAPCPAPIAHAVALGAGSSLLADQVLGHGPALAFEVHQGVRGFVEALDEAVPDAHLGEDRIASLVLGAVDPGGVDDGVGVVAGHALDAVADAALDPRPERGRLLRGLGGVDGVGRVGNVEAVRPSVQLVLEEAGDARVGVVANHREVVVLALFL